MIAMLQAKGDGDPLEVQTELQALAQECEKVLRTGPGGDLRKFLKRQHKPLILRLMLGQHCPVQVGASLR